VEALALSAPTEIQRIGVPEVLAGGDVLLMSQVRVCGIHVASLTSRPPPPLSSPPRILLLSPSSPPFEFHAHRPAEHNNRPMQLRSVDCEKITA
jgi:hypothetical protein